MTTTTSPTASRRFIRLIPRSGNAKTGPIPQTYSARWTCPVRCPFRGGGCYADGVRTCKVWDSADGGARALDLAGLVEALKAVPPGVLLRHNVAGDCARPGTSELDADLVRDIVDVYAAARVRPYSYTHCVIDEKASACLREAAASGFVVNASVETASAADAALDQGVPACITVPDFESMPRRTPAGRRIVPCPAQLREGMTCMRCELCARKGRSTVIAFAAHGTRVRAAREAIAAVQG